MEFAFTEEQAMIAETARGFFAEHATSARTRQAMAADGIDRALWTGFCTELGLAGIGVPEALGGPGFDTLTYALVMEELSRGYASVADQCGLLELISSLLVRHGTPAQQALLPAMLAMKTKVAYCITEPEAGTDVSGIRTTAVRDGDGWMLNGGKIWIHNAPVADLGFVLARTDKDAGNRGMSIFIVDLRLLGVPDPALVRPEPVLRLALAMLLAAVTSFLAARLGLRLFSEAEE